MLFLCPKSFHDEASFDQRSNLLLMMDLTLVVNMKSWSRSCGFMPQEIFYGKNTHITTLIRTHNLCIPLLSNANFAPYELTKGQNAIMEILFYTPQATHRPH